MLRGEHLLLRQQHEVADTALPGQLDHGAQQRPSGSVALPFRRHGQRPDLGLALVGQDLPGVGERQQHDGPEDPAVIAG